jgi:hypothetical protein
LPGASGATVRGRHRMAFQYFVVTGVLTNGRRFKAKMYYNWKWANSINLYKGSVWGVGANGRRTLLKRVGW